MQRVGTWTPDAWPSIGSDFIVPTGLAQTVVARVVSSFKGRYVIVECGGVQWNGYPRVVVDTAEVSPKPFKIWDFEERVRDVRLG